MSIDNETEAQLDTLYQRWQVAWTEASTTERTAETTAALTALHDVYEILGLETP